MEAEGRGTLTRNRCAFRREELTITVDSRARWDAQFRRLSGRPDGPQTVHYVGSATAVRSDGRRRSCDFDYTVVRDPETGTRKVDGTICGQRASARI